MKYQNVTHNDILNGEGIRVVLWVSGCQHQCKNCHNPITWDVNDGLEFDETVKQEIIEELHKDYISGITFSGGDPFHPSNITDVLNFTHEIKQIFSNKNIWVYTGYLMEEILEWNLDISDIDVIIDGKFIDELHSTDLHWVGSSNQRIIDVKQTLHENKIILYKELI